MSILAPVVKWFRRDNRRLAARMMIDEPVVVRAVDVKNRIHGTLADLSPGGACLRICQNFSIGDPLRISISVSKRSSLELKGRIVHVQAEDRSYYRRYGISFFGLGAEAKHALAHYLVDQLFCRSSNQPTSDELVRPFSRLSLRNAPRTRPENWLRPVARDVKPK